MPRLAGFFVMTKNQNQISYTVDPKGDWARFARLCPQGWQMLGTIQRGDESAALALNTEDEYVAVLRGRVDSLSAPVVRLALDVEPSIRQGELVNLAWIRENLKTLKTAQVETFRLFNISNIETTESGLSWKLQVRSDGEWLTVGLGGAAHLQRLGSWNKYLREELGWEGRVKATKLEMKD